MKSLFFKDFSIIKNFFFLLKRRSNEWWNFSGRDRSETSFRSPETGRHSYWRLYKVFATGRQNIQRYGQIHGPVAQPQRRLLWSRARL
jgi:hypothetical protein